MAATTRLADNSSAARVGWHISKYNLYANVPGTDRVAIANLFKGTFSDYGAFDIYALNALDELPEDHPLVVRLAERGLIVNFDELEALKTLARDFCSRGRAAGLTICPTMGCNFDCPYCFEDHIPGFMTKEVQDDVVALVKRMTEANGSKTLHINWFGGEPLLAPDIIDSLSQRLISFADDNGIKYSAAIITNGYLLDQSVVDMLARSRVISAQITLDGVGADHDATRHLAGGGSTFERITDNLRKLKIPFKVRIRQNIHEGNKDTADDLKAYVDALREESGNDITYYAAQVTTSDNCSDDIETLCGSGSSDIGIKKAVDKFVACRGGFCGANTIYHVGVDEKGNLQKCWENVDKPNKSFGTASRWDPADPVATADHPDKLTCYLNSWPIEDKECLDCIWLPACAGSCPDRLISYGKRDCLPYRDEPEKYVLALYEQLMRKRRNENNQL